MLLRLHTPLSADALGSVLGLAADLGYRTRFADSARRVLELEPLQELGAGQDSAAHRSRFEDLACVAAILDTGAARELHARTGLAASDVVDTVVRVGAARFGGEHFALIGGPCAVEDEARLLEIARAVRDAGGTVLRGGAFKPRSSPYSFQGLGERGLELLALAREATGLAIVTEVLDPRDVERVGSYTDMFQIGSRSMSNAALLAEVGRTQVPVLLKRGLAATAREFLMAAEYVLAGGNPNVVLCERGVRGFDTVTRNLLDLGTVAHLKRATHLPVLVDPSHAAGRADLVRPLARAAVAVGADGLIIETHPNPAEVHSDGAQAVSLSTFADIARDARQLIQLDGRVFSEPSPETVPVDGETAL